jgi:hypothetical protein
MANAKKQQFGTVSAALDRDLAKRALEKRNAGQTPSATELAALKRLEKEREENLRWQYYAAIPQKHWLQMAGRQAKVVNEQAITYGIPFNGPVVNLPEVVRGVHDFLARNARRLRELDDDLMSGDSNSPALERYREERAALARLDRLEREAVLVRKDVVRDGTGRIASRLRLAVETLERLFGPEAADILREALDDAEREIHRSYGHESNGHADDQQPG